MSKVGKTLSRVMTDTRSAMADRFLLLIYALLMLSAISGVSAECSFPFTPNQVTYDFRSSDFQSLFDQVSNNIKDFVSQNGISSYGVAVLHGNQTIFTSGATTTPFRCASITKTFTALGALMLRDRGLLALDDPINRFLPDFSVVNPYGQHNITFRELMSHTSGLPMQFCPFLLNCTNNETEVLKQIGGMELVEPPWSNNPVYSNLGIALLGHAWEKATSPRVTWWDFLRDNVVSPLRMTTTGINLANVLLAANSYQYARQDLEWSAPAAQMYSTVEDLAKYLGFVITGYPRFISDASRREWFRPSKLYSDGQSGYAMPWELRRLAPSVSPDFIVTKAGDINGYRSNIGFHQNTRLGVVILTVYSDPFAPSAPPAVLNDNILSTLIPQIEVLTNRTIATTYDGVYRCARSRAFLSPTLNSTVTVLGGTITVTSNDTLGLTALFNVNLQNAGGSPYVAGGANSLLLKNATDNSFWFGDGTRCDWFLLSLSQDPALRDPNTPGSAYTNVLRFDVQSSSLVWPTVGANCTRS